MTRRFCLLAATAAAALCAFGELSPKAWNGGASGEWGVGANWDPAGVPTADDAVTIGSGTVTISGAAAAAGSLTVASGAKLFFGCEGLDVTKMTPLADVDANDLALTVAGDFAVNGQCAIGGADRTGKSEISVGGDLSLGANAKMAVYAGFASTNENFEVWAEDGGSVAVGGKLTTASGAWIYPFSHGTSGCSIRFTVGGDVEIAAGGGFDANMRGFKFPHGPGATIRKTGWNEGCGACYANYAYIHGGTKVSKIYGYKCAPFQSGSPGQASGNDVGAGAQGGGVIRIHAQGDVRLYGSLTANGGISANGASSGGSVWVTCDKFSADDAAKISVKGGSMASGYNSGGGSGGRVAIITAKPTAEQLDALYATGTCEDAQIVTEAVNDPLLYKYPNLIDLAGGTTQRTFGPSGAGTAVIMINLSGSATLSVGARPSMRDVEVPASSPEFGMTLVSGTVEATCEDVRFVPNTDERQRRLCVGYVYSNAVGTVVHGQGTSCSITASDAAAHWLEWDYSDLEYRLRAAAATGGSVTGVEGLSAESPDSWYDFDAAAQVTLTAVADDGWRFLGWHGDVDAAQQTDNPLALTMDKPRDVRAIFVLSAAPAELAAQQDGEWFEATTWGGAGVPGSETAVTLNGRKVVNTYPFAMQMRSLTLSGNAALKVWGTGTDATSMSPIEIQGDDASLDMTVLDDVTIADTACLSIGGLNSHFVPKFTVGGSLVLSGSGKLVVYAGETPVDPDDVEKYVGDGAQVTISNSLTLADTSWVYPQCHYVLGGGVRWTVGGDVEIAAGGGFDATGRGYRPPNGPGYSLSVSTDGEGGSYGGLGGTGAGQLDSTRKGGLPYGFAKAPFMCGSAGRAARVESTSTSGGIGGGSIRIHAEGKVTLAGKLLALPTLSSGSGAGGGVWITCDEFVAADGAKIDAYGLGTTYGWAGAGGGGRVAIMTGKPTAKQLASLYETGECKKAMTVTENVTDPAAWSYPNLIDVHGGDNQAKHACSIGQAGTAVWLRVKVSGSLLMVR